MKKFLFCLVTVCFGTHLIADGPITPCSGLPTNTVIMTPSTGICPNNSALLGLVITSLTGLQYQWQTAPIQAGPFVSISGATLNSYTTPNLVVSTWYRAIFTCTNGGATGTTAPVQVVVNPTPAISVNSGTVCSGQSFSLNPSLTPGGGVTWFYSFGAGPVMNPTANASYTVTGSNSCATLIAVSNVTVMPLPSVSVNSGSVCQGGSFTITPSGASSYTITGGQYTVTPAVSTSYSVTGSFTTGCQSASPGISNVYVNPALGPTISANSGTICAGNSFTIIPSGALTYTYSSVSNVVSPVNTSTYAISGTGTGSCLSSNTAIITVSVLAISLPTITVNSGTICKGGSFTMVPAGANNYTFSSGSNIVSPPVSSNYWVIGSNNSGCAAANTVVSSVIVNPALGPTITANSGTVCQGNSFNIIAAGANNYTYSGGSNIVTPFATSNYSIIGADAQGCISANTAVCTVTVFQLPVVGVNSGSVCAGGSFTLVPTGALSYTFANGSAVVTPSTGTSYSVYGKDANGCLSSNIAIGFVGVSPLPNIFVNASQVISCPGVPVNLTAFGAFTYTWSTGNNGSVITVSPSINTSYTVTATDLSGCVGTAKFTQKVGICEGLQENNNGNTLKIILFPVPAREELLVDLTDVSLQFPLEIIVLSIEGKIISKQMADLPALIKIPAKEIETGVYILKVSSSDLLFQKLVVIGN